MNLLKLAMRNLWRRRRRSLLTWLMIFVGTTLIVFSVGISEGTYGNMIELATRSFTGQFQVQAEGYEDKPSLFKTVSRSDSLLAALERKEGIEAVTGRVETAGLVSADNQSTGAFVVGIDPEREPRVSTLHRNLIEGEWLDAADPGDCLPLLLGINVVKRLKAKLGDEISFVGQAADGSIAAVLFRLTGILETGADELDASLALIRLPDAQEMLVLEGRLHRVVGVVEDFDGLDKILRKIDAGAGNRLLSWRELLPDLDRSITTDRDSGRIFLLIILAVVLLGVTNTMLMAVFERTREFGMMLALGTSSLRILALTLLEAFWLTFSGVLAGVGAGALLNRYVAIPMGDEPIDFGGVMIDVMRGDNTFMGNVTYPLIIIAAGVLAGLLPALRAARLSPAQALRQH